MNNALATISHMPLAENRPMPGKNNVNVNNQDGGVVNDRGNLTLRFVDIVESNDRKRTSLEKSPSIVFGENVEGVLSDKTNAFGCLVCSLAGIDDIIEMKRWPHAGVIHGSKRNVAWRVLDAKYFGLAQQRRRLYLLAGGTDFFPENVIFEYHSNEFMEYPSAELKFEKDGHKMDINLKSSESIQIAYIHLTGRNGMEMLQHITAHFLLFRMTE
ncbi:MAG: DNA cytosine methyltransferase [Mitsuokella sp.]